jgi:DNA-directed RNA polymerase specialized sigma24 family protein
LTKVVDARGTEVSEMALASHSDDPAVGLRAVAALREAVDVLEQLQVDKARAEGWSWQLIAQQLGVTKQAVHKKYASGRLLIRKNR